MKNVKKYHKWTKIQTLKIRTILIRNTSFENAVIHARKAFSNVDKQVVYAKVYYEFTRAKRGEVSLQAQINKPVEIVFPEHKFVEPRTIVKSPPVRVSNITLIDKDGTSKSLKVLHATGKIHIGYDESTESTIIVTL